MTAIALGVAVVLVLLMGGSLVRVAIGPTDADRMLGLQLLGSNLTALALLMSEALAMPRLVDLALVFATLAGVTTAVFVATYANAREDRR
ncbi:monovalent cation/H+ antiporter complex subunit F [Rubellimicrobium roseum]|uniref:Multiple resistance and pH regulation protein F n=1 Tax=Rubellimicrobium roseum TaxID=687525 RepID=A0A5C4NB26_9RHOB|nr:monovalent cation/H+ antiporter complex subunit F [Rubellimicrobium roseum]TNC65802.1 multiple resistance and pH regulation protein F [Rubellimicrobium roseum]